MIRFSIWSVGACLLAMSSLVWAQSVVPVISPGGIVNAADYTPVFAPGMNIAVFGDSLASKISSAAATPLPTALDGTSVEVNGQAIPLFFVSPKQINAQMPFGISGQIEVRVRTATGVSAPAMGTVVPSAPRLFTKTMDGKGEPILVHNTDWSLVSGAFPAKPGEYLILFLTGLGAVSPPMSAGQAGGDNGKNGPLNQLPDGAVTVFLDGKPSPIIFAGLAPGWVGLYQINFQAPVEMPRAILDLVVATKDGSSQPGVRVAAEGAPNFTSYLGGGVKMDFVAIPAGQFTMGCSPGDSECVANENPPHQVQITKSFQMGKYEVTQGQWEAVMGSNPSPVKGNDLPVDPVSWNDIQGFLSKLNARNDGYHYRLPTEAEWEYAARAGTTDKYSGGVLNEIAWNKDNSGSKAHPVGEKKPNAWGLYDMLGNVWESCQDWYRSSYSAGAVVDPPGPSSGSTKVIRGGSWGSSTWLDRVSCRGGFAPDSTSTSYGFRCVRER